MIRNEVPRACGRKLVPQQGGERSAWIRGGSQGGGDVFRVDPEPARGWWHGLKLAGTGIPGVVRNRFIVAVVGPAIFLTAQFGLWSGAIGPFRVSSMGLWPGLVCGVMACWMLYDSKVGKLRERERLLDLMPWRGTEAVLDLGCGRGLMLIGAARRLTTGKATGLDLWQAEDLTGNSPEAALENARREGVSGRVEVKTGDMRKMPFSDASFDVVVSNVAIHNVYDPEGREATMREIARVLKPGGQVVIHDIRYVGDYAAALERCGLIDVTRVGSKLVRIVLFLMTFGSLRPDVVTARAVQTDRGR